MELFSQPIENTPASQNTPPLPEPKPTIIPETKPDDEASPSDSSPAPVPNINQQQHPPPQGKHDRPCQLVATHRLPQVSPEDRVTRN